MKATNKMQNSYDDITSLTGLAGIRAKLSMYLGGTHSENGSPRALTQMLQETLSNALDEHVAGYGSIVKVCRYKDNSIAVFDEGRGLPIDKNLNALTRAFSVPHSSGKFDDSAYSSLGVTGTHGIGMKAVTAASEMLTVVTTRKDKYGTIIFSKGELIEQHADDLSCIDKLDAQKQNDIIDWVSTHETGTVVVYKPDTGLVSENAVRRVLSSDQMQHDEITSMLRTAAFLSPGLQIKFNDEQENKTLDFEYQGGLKQYLSEKLCIDDTDIRVLDGPLSLKTDNGETIRGGYMLAIAPSSSKLLETYVNGVKTSGGTHVNGIKRGLLAAVKAVLPNNKSVNIDDVLSSVAIVAHVQVPSHLVEFEGQTKDVLGTAQVTTPLKNAISLAVGDELCNDAAGDNFRNEIITSVLSHCAQRADIEKLKEQSKTAKNATRNLGLKLSTKLKKASSRNPAERELYIVEGDSASNIGRDPRTQAVLPIRGKIINALKTDTSRLLKNTEVSTIVAALGAGVLNDFDVSKCQYHKLIVACFTGDTKVKLVEGKDMSFKEMIESGRDDFWVWSRNEYGELVPGKVSKVFKTRKATKLALVTLDNGDVIKCTPDHRFMMLDGSYKQADQLKADDRLSPCYVRVNKDRRQEIYDDVNAVWRPVYRYVAEHLYQDEFADAQKRLEASREELPSNTRSIQVHHRDGNKRNDHPDNLEWLTGHEHMRKHGKLGWTCYNIGEYHRERVRELHAKGHYEQNNWKYTYNGSERHVQRVKALHRAGHYRHIYFNNNGYNGSEANRETARRVNKLEHHRLSVKRGKIINTIAYLLLRGIDVTADNYDTYRANGVLKYNKIINYFESIDQAIELAKDRLHLINVDDWRTHSDTAKYDSKLKHRRQVANVIVKMLKNDQELSVKQYDKTKGVRTMRFDRAVDLGLFDSFSQAIEYAKHINHRVKHVEFIDSDEDVYCLSVPDYGNFSLANGVIVKNCDFDWDGQHIKSLIIGLAYKLFPGLIEAGYFYSAEAPLYKATKYINGKATHLMISDDHELNEKYQWLQDNNYVITRFKGLGEMNVEEARETLANPETRKLVQITLDDAVRAYEVLNKLIGPDLNARREWVLDKISA